MKEIQYVVHEKPTSIPGLKCFYPLEHNLKDKSYNDTSYYEVLSGIISGSNMRLSEPIYQIMY